MAEWWKERIVYQIYPRSFCDTNGDGVGDIPGIISKLDYLQSLGVGVLWLSPLYPSPNHDNGYDISDYCAIHHDFGTMADMDELIVQAHRRDIKLLMDLVINHTSDQHDWFQKSRQRIEPYTDYYIWQPGEKDGKKPSNWGGFFGGDCWEFDDVRGEYYLHLFAKEQPDLNYRNEAVVAAVEDVMRFWLDRGVDGFRCDVINIIYKESLQNGRWKPALTGSEYYISTEGTHRLLHRFYCDVLSHYDCFTVGETVFVTPKMADDLVNPERGELNAVFSFEHMETDCWFVKWFMRRFSPNRFFKTLTKWQYALPWNTVYFENHDQPRSVSRMGDPAYHDEGAKALCVLLLTLRGTAFMFEGQEIGMTNFDFADMSGVRDIESVNIWNLTGRLHLPKKLRWRMIREKSRDNARTPMQWSAERNAGFTAGTPWLGINGNYAAVNVARQAGDEHSVLSFYKRMIALRNGSDVLKSGGFREVYRRGGVYAYAREHGEKLTVVVNLTAKAKRSPVSGEAVISTCGRTAVGKTLAPYEAAVIRG